MSTLTLPDCELWPCLFGMKHPDFAALLGKLDTNDNTALERFVEAITGFKTSLVRSGDGSNSYMLSGHADDLVWFKLKHL